MQEGLWNECAYCLLQVAEVAILEMCVVPLCF